LIGAGIKDLNGVVTFQGLTVDTNIYDNVILGRIGIRYESSGSQTTNMHLNPRIAQNIAFVLEHGIFLEDNTIMAGVDIEDNLLLGISKNLIGKSFFPKSLLGLAIDKDLFTEAVGYSSFYG
jgi:hypothetical protein